MAGLILLVACSNVASLMARASAARQKEIAVRLAIGAGRVDLDSQPACRKPDAGRRRRRARICFCPKSSIRALLAMMPIGNTLTMLHAHPDTRILVFSVVVALATGLLFGLAPALQGTRLDVSSTLKDAAIVSGGRSDAHAKNSRHRAGRTLISVARRRRPLRENALQPEKHSAWA